MKPSSSSGANIPYRKGSAQQNKFIREVKKNRLRILPNLYKMIMLIFNKIPDVQNSNHRTFLEIDRRIKEMFNKNGDVDDKVTLKELMRFYVDTHRLMNQTAEQTRKFMIYFPMEMTAETREMLVIFNSMPKGLRGRVRRYIYNIAMDREKFPKFGTNEYKARVEEMQEMWENENE